MNLKLTILPGDGIGPEVTREAVRVLERNLAPQIILGMAWGTTISATVDAFEAAIARLADEPDL